MQIHKPITWALLLVVLLPIQGVPAAERRSFDEVPIDELILEVQRTMQRDLENAFVWWLPKEFWAVALQNVPAAQRGAVENIVSDYLVLAVGQFSATLTGTFDFYSREELEDGLKVTRYRPNRDPERLTPLSYLDSNLTEVVEGFMSGMKGTLGPFGESMQLFVFEDRYRRLDARRVDPYEAGVLVVELEDRLGEVISTEFSTPLNTLHRPRICPNGEPAHISWQYCPWSGEKLAE